MLSWATVDNGDDEDATRSIGIGWRPTAFRQVSGISLIL